MDEYRYSKARDQRSHSQPQPQPGVVPLSTASSSTSATTYSQPYGKDQENILKALRRLELCNYAVQEIHAEVDAPTDPEHKADLLVATENLAFEVLDLLQTIRLYVWGPEDEEEIIP